MFIQSDDDEDFYQFDDFEPPSITDRNNEPANQFNAAKKLSIIEEMNHEESK